MNTLKKYGIYKHHKGTLYTILGFCQTPDVNLVIYLNPSDNTLWSRPINEFVMEFTNKLTSEKLFEENEIVKTNETATKSDYPVRHFSFSSYDSDFNFTLKAVLS